MDIENLIADLALILVLGAAATIIFKKLRQPLVLGYIVAGFIAGPHFSWFPSVHNEENIEFWAQIGIVVLLFSLGLEFSFRKLMNVGGSAIVTALIIVSCMMGVGFVVGNLLHLSNINCLFLGGMLSMSSTTIILKAFNDLNITRRKFVPMVMAVLICEDMFAVVMMVLLSSIAVTGSVEGSELIWSILKLVFFLVIWFTVGVFLIPSFFKRAHRLINDETLLIIAMGLCFAMAVFSVYSGFSMALGAFIMGSILAGTVQAEHIEHIVKPVKDLFGAVFFISVGMMVDLNIIAEYAGTIGILSVVVVVGMILFGTIGMLATGQSLRVAVQSGFSLTQIGEFAFIIASLGLSLEVLEPSLYPIVVAVSVITTFFTPYFIRWADPFYNWLEKHLPNKIMLLLDNFSRRESSSNRSSGRPSWGAVIGRYLWRVVLYSVILIAIALFSDKFFIPLLERIIGSDWGRPLAVLATVIVMSPFLLALATPPRRKGKDNRQLPTVPLIVTGIFRVLLTFAFLMWYLSGKFSLGAGITFGLVIVLLIVIFLSTRLRRQMRDIEKRFVHNLNERELQRSGRGNSLVSDLHLASITVGYSCPFVGEKLRNSNIRRKYGVNVVGIFRGGQNFPIPGGEMRIFPGDILSIIGTDEQIQQLLTVIEDNPDAEPPKPASERDITFQPLQINEDSPLIGKTSATARLRDDFQCLLVAIERGEGNFLKPDGSTVFEPGDTLWIVGNNKKLAKSL